MANYRFLNSVFQVLENTDTYIRRCVHEKKIKMEKERKEEIEDYIKDWHWDKKSHKFAFELGKYLFEFMDDLKKIVD